MHVSLRNKLQIIQNKVTGFKKKTKNKKTWSQVTHRPDVFRSKGWLPVSKRFDQIILNHILRSNQGPRQTT